MTFDLQIIFNFGIGAAIAAFGWFFRMIWDQQRQVARDLQKIEVNLPISYVRRDEFSENMREVKQMLRYITDKLDGKADK